jgi:hypothetical protein
MDVETDRLMSLDEMRIHTGFWFALILVGIGAVILAGQAFLNKTPPATETVIIGAVAFLVGGFVSGYLAQLVYENMIDWESDVTQSDLRFPRAIGWLIAGGLGGTAVGVSFKSAKRIQNGVMGGAAGGFVGGLLFDSFGSASTARMFGIVMVGALMSGLIGLIESARTAVWLSVASGELRGRQFPLVDEVTSIGRSRSNRVCLPGDSGIAEKHLDLRVDDNGASFTSAAGPLHHNGMPSVSARLSHGDSLVIGKTEVRIEFRKAHPDSTSSVSQPSVPTSPVETSNGIRPASAPVPRPQSGPTPGPRPVIPVQRRD